MDLCSNIAVFTPKKKSLCWGFVIVNLLSFPLCSSKAPSSEEKPSRLGLPKKCVNLQDCVVSYVHVLRPQGPEICTWAAYHTANYGKKSHLNSDSKSQRCFKWADGMPKFM